MPDRTKMTVRFNVPEKMKPQEAMKAAAENFLTAIPEGSECGVSASAWGDLFREKDMYADLAYIACQDYSDPNCVEFVKWLGENTGNYSNFTWETVSKHFLHGDETPESLLEYADAELKEWCEKYIGPISEKVSTDGS